MTFMILILQGYNVDRAIYSAVCLVGYPLTHLLQVSAKDLSKV